jgi:hypothetical protein
MLGQRWVVFGGVVAVVASACGSDGGKTSPGEDTNQAGAGGEVASVPEAGTGNAQPGTGAGAGGQPDVVGGGMPGEVMAGGGAGGGAAGAGGEGGAAIVVSPDVHGTFYGSGDGFLVLVNGVNAPIDAEGHFSAPDVADEYQLIVYAPDYKFVEVWDDVRTRAPVIDLNLSLGDPPYSATIRGKLKGGLSTPYDVADDETVFTELVYASSTNGYLYPRSSIDPPEGFDLNPQWFGAATDTGEVLALQYVFKNKVGVTEYTGFGRRPMTIEDGNIYGSANGAAATDIQVSAPTVETLTGHLALPTGWTRQSSFVHMGPFMPDLILENDFSLLVPQLADVPMWLRLEASGADGLGDFNIPVPTQGPWNIDIPNPPKPLSPAEGANAVTPSTIFSWNGLPNGSVAGVYFEVGDWRIERYTTAPDTTLPDLSALGVTLPTAAEGTWLVEAIGPATTTDDVLTVLHKHNLEVADSSYYLDSASRTFTSAP